MDHEPVILEGYGARVARLKTVKGPDACWVFGPFLFCRWLCRLLACDGRRFSVHPRCAGARV